MQNPPTTPLAERLRPKTLSSYIGQEHLVGNDGPIKKAIKNKLIPIIAMECVNVRIRSIILD